MKICFWMTSAFSLGGTKRVVTDLANELLAMGHDVTIMTHENRMVENRAFYNLRPDIPVDFINIYDFIDTDRKTPKTLFRKVVLKCNNKTGYFNTPGRAEYLSQALLSKQSRIRLAQYLNSKHYDVVIATARMGLWLAMISPYLSCKTVGWQHSAFDAYLYGDENGVFKGQECVLQKYLPKLSTYVVLSPYDQRDYKEKLNINTVVRRNPCNMTTDRISDQTNKRFLMMCRFVPLKGIDMAIDAFEKFARYDDEWELDIVGDGPLRESMLREVEERGLAHRIHMPGYTSKPERYYQNSSINLLTSRFEGWGMSVIEGNVFGLPTIAFQVNSLDLVVRENITGLLVKPFDTDQFAQAMLKLAHDTELRKKFSSNALENTSQYKPVYIAKEWEKMLSEL